MVDKETSYEYLQLRSIVATLKALGNSEDIISWLLAKHDFESEEAFELMFVNPIRSMPPTIIGDSSVVKSRKGKEKVAKTSTT